LGGAITASILPLIWATDKVAIGEYMMQPTSTTTVNGVKICTFNAVGHITPPQCEEHVRQMVDCAQDRDCCRFLLDLQESTYVGSLASQYNMAYERAGALGLRQSWKIALLVSSADFSHDFQAVTAQNAGYDLKQFNHRETALAWLCE
jgi:hypothetical protein